MRCRIGYVMVVGVLLLGVSSGHGQGGGAPSGTVGNSSSFQTVMGLGTVIRPIGACGWNTDTTVEPRVSVEYGTVDDKGKQTMVATNQPTSLTKQENGTYLWSRADFSPITAGTTYYVKATLYGKPKGMPPGKEKELASNTVFLYP